MIEQTLDNPHPVLINKQKSIDWDSLNDLETNENKNKIKKLLGLEI